jgi:predicted Fe-Mo cluster-binding NifX family protein
MSANRIVAVACETELGLRGDVCAHFGHAPYFAFAELDGAKVVSSRLVVPPAHGEGPCTMPEFIRRKGARALIVGGLGARAQAMLAGMGIEVYGGISGNAGDALRALAGSALAKGDPACPGHGDGEHRCGSHT